MNFCRLPKLIRPSQVLAQCSFIFQKGSLSCSDNNIECYVLDNNGFVVISEDKLNTGKFFGEIDGTVLNSLVKNQVFKKIKVYDYQVSYYQRL